jgi:hypothetical protein
MGVGGAVLVGAAVTAGVAKSRHSELEQTCPSSCTREQIDAGRRTAIAADVLFGVGGAAVATGFVLLLVERSRPRAPAPERGALDLWLGPFGVALRGGF